MSNVRRRKYMRIPFLTIVVAASLLGCATQPAPENSYSKGVAAYKVKDYAGAREHWSKASEEGYVSALDNLGYLLYYGLGGEADQAQGIQLWRRAALLGHSEAQWHLGQAFEDGEGISQDIVEAYAWYRCAVANAEQAPEGKKVEGQIAEDARKSLTALLGKLTPDQFATAERLAKRYIEDYAKSSGA